MRTTTTYLFYLTILWFLVISTHGQSFSTFPSSTAATPTSSSPTRVNEPVDFSTITAWSALPLCLQQQLQLYDGGVAAWIGCNNNFCLCSESFAAAEDQLASDALQECSYVSNMNSATSILSEYCSQHGFTRLLGATSLNTAGIPTRAYNEPPEDKPTSEPESKPGSRELDNQSIIGIVFGIVGFFVGIAAVIFAYRTWKFHQRNSVAAQTSEAIGNQQSDDNIELRSIKSTQAGTSTQSAGEPELPTQAPA